MKEFFENLGKVVVEKAGEVSKKTGEVAEVVAKKTGEVVEVVAKKTEQTVEVQKLKSQISLMERNNERDYKDIGKIVYDKFKKGEEVGETFAELCEAIAAREASIGELKVEIAEVKGLDVCSKCGGHIEPSAQYCPKCGAKTSEEAEFEEE